MEQGRVYWALPSYAAGLKAIEVYPDTPDRVLRAITADLTAQIRMMYPRAHIPNENESFQQLYLHFLNWYLSRGGLDRDTYAKAEPGLPALVAICCVAFVSVFRLHPQAKMRPIPDSLDMESLTDTLASTADNVLGQPSGSANAMTEALADVYRQMEIPMDEDMAQSALLNVFLGMGGPTPGLIEQIVNTGEIPYEAKELLDMELVRATYEAIDILDGLGIDLTRELLLPFPLPRFQKIPTQVEFIREVYRGAEWRYNTGFQVEDVARELARESEGQEPIDGLRGRWVEILIKLTPFLLLPAVVTASYLPTRMTLAEAIAANRQFQRRYRWRGQKGASRESVRVPRSLDDDIRTDEGIIPLHERMASGTETANDRDIGDVLDALRLTPRERSVAELLAEGHSQEEIAGILKVNPSRISQLVQQIRAKMSKKS